MSVDQLVLRKVYQPLVDAMGVQPEVLARQAILLEVVITVLRLVLSDWNLASWFLALNLMTILPYSLLLCQSPALLKAFSADRPILLLRYFMLSMLVLHAVGWVLVKGPHDLAPTASAITFTSFLYFAACNPPPPPKRSPVPTLKAST
jgi:hypothetical protein